MFPSRYALSALYTVRPMTPVGMNATTSFLKHLPVPELLPVQHDDGQDRAELDDDLKALENSVSVEMQQRGSRGSGARSTRRAETRSRLRRCRGDGMHSVEHGLARRCEDEAAISGLAERGRARRENGRSIVTAARARTRRTPRTRATIASSENRVARIGRGERAHRLPARRRSPRISIAACAMPSTSPTGAENAGLAVAHDFGKSADVGADHRHAGRQRLERAQAERLAARRQQKEIGAGQQRRDGIDLAEEEHLVLRRRARRASSSASTRSGPSPTMTSTRRHCLGDAREDAGRRPSRASPGGSSRRASAPSCPRRPARRASTCSATGRRRRDR